MVIKVHGGIGNQLFQLCFWKYIFLKTDRNVKLDMKFFKDIDKQKYPRENCLDILFPDIENLYFIEKKIQKNLVSRFLLKNKSCKKFNLFQIINSAIGNVLTDKSFFLTSNFNLLIGKKIYYDGYWQQFKYLKFGLDEIKKALEIEKPVFNIEDDSIAVHIRRGDYLKISNDGINNIVLELEYYVRALEYFQCKFKKLKCEIFTDDYSWCKLNLNHLFPDIEFSYSGEFLDDLTSLFFMSKHKNIIVANSTYSLWGFYLSNCSIASVPLSWIKSNESNGNYLIDSKKFYNLGLLSIYDKNN